MPVLRRILIAIAGLALAMALLVPWFQAEASPQATVKEHPVAPKEHKEIPAPSVSPEVEAVNSAVESYNSIVNYLAFRASMDSLQSYIKYREDQDFRYSMESLGNYLASRQVQRVAPAPQQQAQQQAPSGGGGGSCYGGVVPDYIVNHESGGDPNALNPSGAFGCYQIMPEWWSKPGPNGCAQFDRSVEGQKRCAQVIMNTQGMDAWSETR